MERLSETFRVQEGPRKSEIPENCMVCASPMSYLIHAKTMKCHYCQRSLQGHMRCAEGHFVCESCHNEDALKFIKDISFTTKNRNPFETAELMMSLPSLPMLGCQHAWIVGGALMSALKNNGFCGVTDSDIEEVYNRIAGQAKGGYCGLTGLCGITVAVGASISVLLKSVCGSDREQKITMDAAIRAAGEIASLTGPSCCKAYARASIEVAVEIMSERFGIHFDINKPSGKCLYVERHPHGCRKQKCPYFEDSNKTTGAISS